MRRGIAWLLVAALAALAAGGAALGVAMAPVQPPAGPALSGFLRGPGGQFLYDRAGRVVLLHGVNVVYKHAPYEVYPDPGEPWNFDASDARRMARLGFDVVRLGIIWAGLEPGTAPANDPAICQKGRPRNPHQLDLRILYRYLDRLRETVDLLGRHHIYTLLDMHQDLYSGVLGGEGAPRWAVCTNGVAPTRPPGRWSLMYGTVAEGIAFHHFWVNDVVGNLQGQFDEVWSYVARFFRDNPWVVGFDPFNEPFATSVHKQGHEQFDAELECFYTGRAHPGGTLHGAPPLHCPSHDPRTGVVPTILRNAPHQLIFDEPDIFSSRGYPTYLGPMDFDNLVYNIHVYCTYRNPVTGNPTDVAACAAQDDGSLRSRREDRQEMASQAQPHGPAWFVSEFGATSNATILRDLTSSFDHDFVGWTYWSWKYYDDPTGSTDEALVMSTGGLQPTARVLSQTYAEAVAGTPLAMSFDPTTGSFHLRYRAAQPTTAPTVVFVATSEHYPHGYCAVVSGGTVASAPGSDHLEVVNARGARTVRVSVTAGRCRLR